MLCPNCGKPIVDTARFCSFCGLQQRDVERPSQPASGDPSADSPMPDSALEASDVTVILPRRRANAIAAPATHQAESTPSASTASEDRFGASATDHSSVRAMKIIGAAVIAIIAVVVAASFHANRSATPAGEVAAAPAAATEP